MLSSSFKICSYNTLSFIIITTLLKKLHYFNLKSWSAWSFGELSECLAGENLKQGTPKLDKINAMVKRRMPKLAKYIYELNQALLTTLQDTKLEKKHEIQQRHIIPTIYASKNAELCRTFKIIRSFSSDVSPAQFSMSVHNAIAGLLSVIDADTSPYSVIDSLSGTLETAILEAISLFSEHQYVKIIYFDEELPQELDNSFANSPNRPVVLSLLIEKGRQYALDFESNKQQKTCENLPELVALLSAKKSSYSCITPRLKWTWHKSA